MQAANVLDEDQRLLLKFCSVLAKAVFSVALLQTIVVLNNRLIVSLLMLVALLAVPAAAMIGREFILHGHPRRAIAVVSTTLFVCAIGCALLDSKVAPVCLLASLLSVGLAMPFLSSKELKGVCLASAGSIAVIGFEFVFVHLFEHTHTPESDLSMFVALCAAGWVCLSWLLGFHTRLFKLVTELTAARSNLEGQVQSRTRELEEELRRARELESQIRRAREQIILAREEERRRLKRELHDEFAPTISGCILTLDDLSDNVTDRPQAAPEALGRVCRNLRAIVGDMRQLAYTLFLPAEFDLGLRVAIGQLVERQRRDPQAADLDIVLDLPTRMPELPAAVEVAALRIVQEGLTNVVRHACATRCTVTARIVKQGDGFALDADDQSGGQSGGQSGMALLELCVTDDGVGMPPNQLSGVGISAMRERANELGGQLEILSVPRSGTTLTARIPATLSQTHDQT